MNPDDEMRQFAEGMMKGIVQALRPIMVERLRVAQEEKPFVTVVGGEPLVDFERVFDILYDLDEGRA